MSGSSSTLKSISPAWKSRLLDYFSSFHFALLGIALPLVSGCAFSPFVAQSLTTSYQPSNSYREEAALPAHIKRIAVLPLTTLVEEASAEFGRDALWPVLMNELGRARLFELVHVSPDELRLLTGRSHWSGEEKLPLNFFELLKDKLGVDAVLFSRLTQYRAYEPLAVGWRLKLMDAEEPRILWAVDEVFDARAPEVAAAARRYAQGHPDTSVSLRDSQSVLLSPHRFGQFTVNAVVASFPAHGGKTE